MSARGFVAPRSRRAYPAGMAMQKSTIYGIIGGLAWFVAGLLIGHFFW